VTATDTAVGATLGRRWRTAHWIVLAVLVIAAIAVVGAYLTAPRPGGTMDPRSTSPDGARALVSLLREQGVDVIEADTVADVERAARPDSLVVIAQTFFLSGNDQRRRLAGVPGDRLLIAPGVRTREALAPDIRSGTASTFGGGRPNCGLREAVQAGTAQFGTSNTYEAGTDVPLTRCYGGAVVRYRSQRRTVTVVGTADFMSNAGLLEQGNAALAMNLAGARSHVVWYAPQHFEGESTGGSSLLALIPDVVSWIVLQLCLVVVLLAVWRGRRVGPLVAEQLPVVVRASETVEGRGRLYRSRRARDRAADALRTAALHRLLPRLGLTPTAEPAAVVAAVTERSGADPAAVGDALFGPVPTTDADLVALAHQLDDIERQVAQS
jgi:Domain of unknown function (DUF4350)